MRISDWSSDVCSSDLRRALEPQDVRIDILYCGICHSDVHFARGACGDPRYPCVPGHEIVGRVSAVGECVARFQPGALVRGGCMSDSCAHRPSCGEVLEHSCENGCQGAYMAVEAPPGHQRSREYSAHIVLPT